MPKITIGYITNTRLPAFQDEAFQRVARQLRIKLLIINSAKQAGIKAIEKKASRCALVYNSQVDLNSLEIAKQLEFMGHRVVETTRSYYYTEDKWFLYLMCLKNKIPTPKTILLSSDLVSARDQIKKFKQFPVILKRVQGFGGDFVDRAETPDQAVAVIKKFWKKGEDRFPIIAQEFVLSDSYRVLTIGRKIVQTARKKRFNWKATGGDRAKFEKFEIDRELEELIKKIIKFVDIEICGLDFAKDPAGHWLLIEVNSGPAYDFFRREYAAMIRIAMIHLLTLAKKKNLSPSERGE